jgi:hypothetical protein
MKQYAETDKDILFKDYHDQVIFEAELKLSRKLTEEEKAGIRKVHSFLMLESIEMTISHHSINEIEEMLRHYYLTNRDTTRIR